MPIARARQFEEFCRLQEKDAEATCAELARSLGVSIRTVERYRARYRGLRDGDEWLSNEAGPERAARVLLWLAKLDAAVAPARIYRYFACEYGVGPRTAQRCLEDLVKRGLVARSERGYELRRDLAVRPMLNQDELDRLISYLASYGRRGPFGRRLDAVLAKLRLGAAGTPGLAERARKRETRILIKGPCCRQEPAVTRLVDILLTAAEEGRALHLSYNSPQFQEQYRPSVRPLGMVHHWLFDEWYLLAENVQSKKTEYFRLDRLTSCEPLAAEPGGRMPTPGGMLQYAWVMENGPLREVRVLFHDDFNVLEKVRRDTAGRSSARLSPAGSGDLLYEDTVAGLGEFSRWLRQFGASAEVLAPAELKELLRAGALRKLARYGVADPGDSRAEPGKTPLEAGAGGTAHG